MARRRVAMNWERQGDDENCAADSAGHQRVRRRLRRLGQRGISPNGVDRVDVERCTLEQVRGLASDLERSFSSRSAASNISSTRRSVAQPDTKCRETVASADRNSLNDSAEPRHRVFLCATTPNWTSLPPCVSAKSEEAPSARLGGTPAASMPGGDTATRARAR